MKKLRMGFFGSLIIISYLALCVYHIWTAILAFINYGTFWGVLVLFAPVISQLFLNGVYIAEFGFFNTYTLALVGILLLYGIGILMVPKD